MALVIAQITVGMENKKQNKIDDPQDVRWFKR